jgi:acyl-CoA thioesterase II
MTQNLQPLPLAPSFVPLQVTRAEMGKVVGVIDLLTLERLDDLLFRNRINQININGSLFGGQVLAQALAAACGTVAPDRPPHSLHGYFLRAGDAALPVIYQVDRTRDGGSFSTRRVVALQKGVPILHMECSFHRHEETFDRQMAAPDLPGPDGLATLPEILNANADRIPQAYLDRFGDLGPFEVRPVDPAQALGQSTSDRRAMWIRVPSMAESHNPLLHQIALVYLSDFWLAATAVSRDMSMAEIGSGVRISSLDHALWFHRPLRADEWLLYDTDSPSIVNGTGVSRGLLFDQAGALVATVTQEALYRPL